MVAGLLGLASAEHLPVALGCCVLTGFGLILFFSIGQSVVQLGAGSHNRGQGLGIWAMGVSGAQPLGNLLAGPAADHWGVQTILAAEGVFLGAAALVFIGVFALVNPE